MDERKLAAELQAHKNDPSEWDEPQADAPPAKKKRLQAMVSVRFAPAELERVQQKAEANGQTVSGYLRSLAVRDLEEPSPSMASFAISISSGGTYSAQVATPSILTDGRRLTTSVG